MSKKKKSKGSLKKRRQRQERLALFLLLPVLIIGGLTWQYYRQTDGNITGLVPETVKTQSAELIKQVEAEKLTAEVEEVIDQHPEVAQDEPVFVTNSNGVRLISHRGQSLIAPESTAAAFKAASDNGFTEWEADVRFTKDGVAVIAHNDEINDLARTSDGQELEQEVLVSNSTYEELLTYDFGSRMGEEFKGEKILTFDEFVALAKELDVQFLHVELKVSPTRSQKVDLYESVYKYGFAKKLGFQSFNIDVLRDLGEIDDTVQLEYVADSIISSQLAVLDSLKNDKRQLVVSLPHYTTEEEVKMVKDAGYEVYIFTVDVNNHHLVPQYYSWEVDAIMTDLLYSDLQ